MNWNYIILIACWVGGTAAIAQPQTIDTNYFPAQRDEVSDEDYRNGMRNIKSIYENIRENNEDEIKGFTCATYWNMAVAYRRLGESKEKVYDLLLRSFEQNGDSFCGVVSMSIEDAEAIEKTQFYRLIGQPFVDLVTRCEGRTDDLPGLNAMLSRLENEDFEGLNKSLAIQLVHMADKDQRYRKSKAVAEENWESQKQLDKEVHDELIQIFKKHGYPGEDIVGKSYRDFGCLMLEHTSNLVSQEKYLPMVIQAMQQRQLSKDAVRMLLDRIYSTTTGEQIFGSHVGMPYAKDEVIAAVKKKYGL